MIKKKNDLYKQIVYSVVISLFICSIYFLYLWQSSNKVKDESSQISTISVDSIPQNNIAIANQINEILLKLKNEPTNTDLLLKLAILYKKNGLFSTAAQQLEKAYSLDPNNQAILNELGIIYYYLCNYDKSLSIFEKLNKKFNNSEYKQNLAFVLYKNGNYEKASQILNEINLKTYKNYEIPMVLGNIAFEKNNIPLAIDYFEKSININAKSASLHYNLGMLLSEINNEELAIKEFETAEQLDNNDATINIKLAELYNKEHKIEKAKELYVQLTNSKDNIISSIAYLKLGEIYYFNGLYSNAIDSLRNSISNFNNNFEALCNLGNLFFDIGQTQKSVYFFEQAKKISPNDFNLNFNLANIFFELKEYSKAAAIWEKITNNYNIDEYTAYKISKTFYHIKKYDLSLEYAVKTIESDQQNLEYKLNLGNIYLALKNIDSAIEQYNICLNANQKYNYLNKVIGKAYYDHGSFSDALAYLNKYLDNNNKDSDAYDMIGEIYFRNNDLDSAVQYWNNAYKINSKFIDKKLNQYKQKFKKSNFENSEKLLLSLLQIDGINIHLRLHLADLYLLNGDVYKAINQWENVINIDYNNNVALENLAKQMLETGESQDAIRYLKQLNATNPSNVFAAKNLSRKYFDNNNFYRVIDILKPIVSNKMTDQEVLYMYAVSLHDTGNTNKAYDLFNRIIRINPNSSYASNSTPYLSEITVDNSNISNSTLTATDLYTKTMEEGNKYFSIGDYDSAIQKYKEAIKINSNYKEPYLNILKVLKLQGKTVESQKYAQKFNLN